MSDRYDFYTGQAVQSTELDNAFAALETSDRQQTVDMDLSGIASGLDVDQNASGADLTVDVQLGVAYSKLGERIGLPFKVDVDLSQDENGASTAVLTSGDARVVSVYLGFDRTLTDPRPGGVFFSQAESYEIFVRMGAVNAYPVVDPEVFIDFYAPALDPEAILLADIVLIEGQTAILDSDIHVFRREMAVRLDSPNYSFHVGTLGAAIQEVLTAFDSYVSAPIDAIDVQWTPAAAPAWADASSPVGGNLEAVISDNVNRLGGVNGSTMIGGDAYTYRMRTGSVNGQQRYLADLGASSMGAQRILLYPTNTVIDDHAILEQSGVSWSIAHVPASTITNLTGNVLTTTTGTYNLSPVLIRGVFDVATNMQFDDTLTIVNGRIRPASGITVTIGSSCKVHANCDWQDTSAGGSFSTQDGCVEFRIPTKVTAPTGGFIFHIGHPDNSIHEGSGTSVVFGGTKGNPHILGATSELSVIGGGYDNTITSNAIASTICGGAHHVVNAGASHASIVGGSFQQIRGDYGFAGGGTLNEVATTYSGNVAGQDNRVGDPLDVALDFRSAFNGAGANNDVNALRSGNVAGFNNTITNAADEGFNGAGGTNLVTGYRAANLAGTSNNVSGSEATCLGGNSNTSSGAQSIAGGSSATASGNYSVALGEFLRATATGAVATGVRASADLRCQRSHASGYFGARGDAQISDLVVRRVSTASQTLELTLNGGTGERLVMPDDTTWGFKIMLVARNTTSSENGCWHFEGCIKRDSGAASTALVGTVNKTVISEPPAWAPGAGLYPRVIADATNGSLKIEMSTDGTVLEVIRWVARVELVEVTG